MVPFVFAPMWQWQWNELYTNAYVVNEVGLYNNIINMKNYAHLRCGNYVTIHVFEQIDLIQKDMIFELLHSLPFWRAYYILFALVAMVIIKRK